MVEVPGSHRKPMRAYPVRAQQQPATVAIATKQPNDPDSVTTIVCAIVCIWQYTQRLGKDTQHDGSCHL